MSKDESILSGIFGTGADGGTQAHLVKVLANVVETQKSVASQFSALFDRVEEARNETRSNVAALTDEIRKLEIRSNTMFEKVTTQLIAQNEALRSLHASERAQLIAQNEALSSSHASERALLIAQNDNLLNLLKSTFNSAPRSAPVNPEPMNTYNGALTANSMIHFSIQDQFNDQFKHLTPQQIVDLQTRIRQELQLVIQQRQQHEALLASRAADSSTTIAAPSQMPSVSTAAVPSIPVVPAAPTVTSVSPAPVVVTQQSASKVEMKPVVPSPATTVVPAKPMFSFDFHSRASKVVLGGSMAHAATHAPTAGAPFSFVAPKPAISGQSTSAGFSGLTGKPSIFEQNDKVAEGQNNFAILAKSKPFGESAAVAAASTVTSKDEDEEEGNPELYEPDVQFASVIPLADLVQVTGEENETVLFSARSKIFRYIRETREYKERGVGDLKLLHDKAKNKFRVVMRRDGDNELCANFSVLKTLNLITKEEQEHVRSIVVSDFSENENGKKEWMCLKFRNADVAKEFEQAFEDAQSRL